MKARRVAVPDKPAAPHAHQQPRGRGKIAQLPKRQRNLINRMLDNGATYKAVQHEMAKHGVSLNGENISNWFNGPYQDYVRHQAWIAELRSAHESAADLDELSSTPRFQANLLQLAMTEIFRALHEGQSKSDSPGYIRLFNTLARLSREALALRKYEDTYAPKHAPLWPGLDPNPGPVGEAPGPRPIDMGDSLEAAHDPDNIDAGLNRNA